MTTITISYGTREMAPALLKSQAARLGLTTEQLIRRFVAQQLSELAGSDNAEPLPGANWEDYLVRNGLVRGKEVAQ